MRKAVLIFLLINFCLALKTFSQDPDQLISQVMDNKNIQGLSVAIVKQGKIVFTMGYGYADVERNIPFTPATINAEIASLSKTVTATALMQLWEKKLFKLDDPVNDYLPFPIVNPNFPNVPVTFRMLLTHTSSLKTDYDIGRFDFRKEHFPKLGNFLYDILNVKGAYYSDTSCFTNSKPGTKWFYCGTNYAIIGYLVEIISKTPFDEYCKKNIFSPLGMKNTSWHFMDLDTNMISRPYQWNDEEGKMTDFALYEYPTYPEGQLKTSVTELSKFLWMSMNDGEFDGKRILQKSTMKLMLSDQFSISDTTLLNVSYGFGWAHIKTGRKDLWGHHGKNQGISTEMIFDSKTLTGLILLANSDEDGATMIPCMNKEDIICSLIAFADSLNSNEGLELNSTAHFNPCEKNILSCKKNFSRWPMNAIPMKLGNYFYNKSQVRSLLELNDNSDAGIILTRQLIAAKLNVAEGCEISPVISILDSANALIGNRKLPVRPSIEIASDEGKKMLVVARRLEMYNDGVLNLSRCGELKSE